MAGELKTSSVVTALAVIGFVFGLIGMLGSFVPCIGSFAFLIGIPATIVSSIALLIAYLQNARRSFAVVALTIGLIGVIFSGLQYFAIVTAGESLKDDLERELNTRPQRVRDW